MKNKEKKGWRPGRNLLTLILAIIILFIVFIAIYIPTSISKSYNEGKTTYFEKYESISYISSVYNADDIEFYDSKDFNIFELKLEATKYYDALDKVYKVGEDEANDEITVNLTVSQKDIDDPVKFSTLHTETSTDYVMYAGFSLSTDWVKDQGYSTSGIRISKTDIDEGNEKTKNKITSNISYPAKKTTCWPFSVTVDSPAIYVYLYYEDDYQKAHSYVVRFAYESYMTDDTIGGIIKN